MTRAGTIAEQVREARARQNLSAAALADLAAVRKATIVDIEGGANVTLETLHRVAAGLGETLTVKPSAPAPEVRPNTRGQAAKKKVRRRA